VFLTSKLLSFLTQPLAWVSALLVLALWWLQRRPGAAQRTLLGALGLGLLVGWQPLPDALLRLLEDRYPAPAAVVAGQLQPFVGVVVLGGALEPAHVWRGRDQVALNAAAERMTVPVALLHQHPNLRLLFTGGEGELWAHGLSEAARAGVFFTSMGVPTDRVWYEDRSRTTHENAVFSAAMPGVDKTQPWLLLTSAWHMPRALASFRAAGWNVTPYPVDYRTGSSTPWTEYSLAQGALRWQIALHEYFGWLAYRAVGMIG
jgi:uncharacterized SAM-binding protein YcdF (DUF218 family)